MPRDWHTRARSDEQIEREALGCLMQAGCANEFAPNVLEIVRRLGASNRRFAGLRLVSLPDSEMPDEEARAHVEERLIEARESVVKGATAGTPRDRMTIAHELGHIVLDHVGAPKQRAVGGPETEAFIPPSRSVERQARVFAAGLLMPRTSVRQCRSAEEVAARMNVSLQAARIRFEQVNVRDVRRTTPPDIEAGMQRLRAIAQEGAGYRRVGSVLSPEVAARLAWELAPLAEGLGSAEYRCINGRYVIRWSRFGQMRPGGWRVAHDRIIAWESEASG